MTSATTARFVGLQLAVTTFRKVAISIKAPAVERLIEDGYLDILKATDQPSIDEALKEYFRSNLQAASCNTDSTDSEFLDGALPDQLDLTFISSAVQSEEVELEGVTL